MGNDTGGPGGPLASGAGVRPLRWSEDGCLALLDQRLLPERVEWLRLVEVAAVARAIRDMAVRGAPAIGIAAAYGAALAARARYREAPHAWRERLAADLALLREARPTAVNLGWALDRVEARLAGIEGDPFPALLAEARGIHEADVAANRRMGALGAALIEGPCGVLTHCNAGALATGGYGTALGVVRSAWAGGRIGEVLAGETRPWLQGARLTAWELLADGIPVTLLADGAAAWAMRCGRVAWVVVGADRVAANGDVANKIGTCALAACARRYGARMMVVAPISTIDPACPSGERIPIEARAADEVLALAGQRLAAAGAGAWNPVFDVTPAELVDVLVTERGVLERPDAAGIARLLGG